MSSPHLVQHLASRELPHHDRLVRLGRALIAMSHDLADSRRRIVALERENATLRDRLHANRGR